MRFAQEYKLGFETELPEDVHIRQGWFKEFSWQIIRRSVFQFEVVD